MLKMKFLKNNILEPVLSAKETLLEGKYNRIILCNIFITYNSTFYAYSKFK